MLSRDLNHYVPLRKLPIVPIGCQFPNFSPMPRLLVFESR